MRKLIEMALSVLLLAGASNMMGCTPTPSGSATAEPKPTPAPQGDTVAPHVAMATAAEPSSAAGSAQRSGSLVRVDDASTVCMVNNTYMGRPQIPVLVDGRTYFGCCDMCKGRLERDPASRVATDPVSGRPVDKAGAVIGRDDSNRVLYFENEANYEKYAGT
jgi:hypothetical protein